MRLGCSECLLGFCWEIAWILQGIRIDFAKKLPPNPLLEVLNPSRRIQNRLQIVWKTAKRCPKAQKTSTFLIFHDFFTDLRIFWPPKRFQRVAKRSQVRSERRPKVPRSGPWHSHEAARDAQGTVLKSPKSMQKQQKCDCGFQITFRRILQPCWTTSAKLRHAFRIVNYITRCNSHVWVVQNVCKAFGNEFG